jgi:hypothetical protein
MPVFSDSAPAYSTFQEKVFSRRDNIWRVSTTIGHGSQGPRLKPGEKFMVDRFRVVESDAARVMKSAAADEMCSAIKTGSIEGVRAAIPKLWATNQTVDAPFCNRHRTPIVDSMNTEVRAEFSGDFNLPNRAQVQRELAERQHVIQGILIIEGQSNPDAVSEYPRGTRRGHVYQRNIDAAIGLKNTYVQDLYTAQPPPTLK